MASRANPVVTLKSADKQLIGQIAAEASLDANPDYMLNNYNEYVNRRKFLIDGLNRIDGVYFNCQTS